MGGWLLPRVKLDFTQGQYMSNLGDCFCMWRGLGFISGCFVLSMNICFFIKGSLVSKV